MSRTIQQLKVKQVGIDTYKQPVIYLHEESEVCISEGFEAYARIRVNLKDRFIIATLNTVTSNFIKKNEAGLSEFAMRLLCAKDGDKITLSHPKPLDSLSLVRSKIYGEKLNAAAMETIIKDVAVGRYSDIHLASFVTACADGHLDMDEITDLTKAMINVGDQLEWPGKLVVDKHCVGGLPGNRTSLIIVPIVAAFGLMIPKTSSRAITSPAGTADTMEVLAPVRIGLKRMKKVVEQENGCIVWGGAVALSPADDILIRVEGALDLDNEGQMVSSVLSKKIAVGSTHLVVDVPVGPTAKIRSLEAADRIKQYLEVVGERLGIKVNVVFTDGDQPVGRCIGPALEAHDVLAVLKNEAEMPCDLRDRSVTLAGHILEFSPKVKAGEGHALALQILEDGRAFKKFQAICEAQGGFFKPPIAKHTYTIESKKSGRVKSFNNRHLTRLAKLAGAPHAKAAGVELHVKLNDRVEKNQPLYTLHAEVPGELEYAKSAIENYKAIIVVA